jgi:predicted ArsR family transcriptional regulator
MNDNEALTRAEVTRRAILALLSGGPLTADALAERLDLSILYVRPRVSELVKRHRLIASGEHGRNASGQWAHKWMAA